MSKLNTLEDLYFEEMRDLYNAEKQLLKALPDMSNAAADPNLSAAFNEHLAQTERHVERLERIFESHNKSPKGVTCKAMKGLVAEGKEMISHRAEPAVRDAGLIGAAQRVEHYEIAGYGCVRTFAKILGYQNDCEILQQTLDEEASTDKRLTTIATKLNFVADTLPVAS